MTFLPPFRKPFSNPFPTAAAGAWWNLFGAIPLSACVAAYRAKGAADYAASKVNLANPGTYNAADGTAYPTWDVTNGWIFVGASSQYLTTGIVPAGNQTWSVIIRYTNWAAANNNCLFGSYSTPAFLVQFNTVLGMKVFNGSTSATAVNAPTITAGVYGFAGKTPYRNGSAETNLIPAGTTTANLGIYINSTNGFTSYSTYYLQAFAIYNSTLNLPQMSALTTAMNAL